MGRWIDPCTAGVITMRRASSIATTCLLAVPGGAAMGQSTLERPTSAPELWTGVPWSLEVSVGPLLERQAGTGLMADPSVRVALALPRHWVAEVRYAPQPVETGGRDEVEGAVRSVWLRQDQGHAFDLGVEGRFGTESDATVAGVAGARWVGPLRFVASTRAVFPVDGDARLVLGAGGIWHPMPGRLPVALAADAASFTDRVSGERIAWTAAVQVGVAFTPHTVSVFATNAGTSLLGRLSGTDRVRLGIEVTGHVPVGRLFGLHADRATALESVRPVEPGEPVAQPVVVIPIREYRYASARVEIPAGTAVEWVNHDDVVHTATADDGAWNSGGLERGERWRAVFAEPGTYAYHCGPHPYMRGVVVVR